MKRLSILLLLIFYFQLLFSSEIQKYIRPCEFMIYVPSVESLINTTKSLMKRFYSKNYDQMLLQMSADSRSSYGIDVFDLKSLEKAGVDIKSPLSFVHISNDTGYLLIPVKSKKELGSFIKTNLKDSVPYQFFGNYVAFSENKTALSFISGESLDNNEGFRISAKKLGFNWDKNFVWMESKYLSGVSSSIGVTANIKLPYGFTALIADLTEQNISVKCYAGIISSNQTLYMQNLRDVAASEKYDMLDYTWGNPALVGQIYMNMPMLYKYYNYIDSINILGIKSLVSELQKKYKVNLERDLVNNSDGRLKIVIDKFDSSRNEYVLYGSLGIKDPKTADLFMDSVKNAILQTDNQLYTFDLFTKPFYHYKTTNYSIFYGVIENDLYFSTDKDVLTNLVKNIYDNKNGSLEKLPSFFKTAKDEKSVGFYFTLDVQSLFNQVKTGIQIDKDLLIGVKDIYLYGYPDSGEKAYGWNSFVDINFYRQ